LNKKQFNKYNLLILQARDKCDKDITEAPGNGSLSVGVIKCSGCTSVRITAASDTDHCNVRLIKHVLKGIISFLDLQKNEIL
jgi:hypothetical protein